MGEAEPEDLAAIGQAATAEGETIHDIGLPVAAADGAPALVAVEALARSAPAALARPAP